MALIEADLGLTFGTYNAFIKESLNLSNFAKFYKILLDFKWYNVKLFGLAAELPSLSYERTKNFQVKGLQYLEVSTTGDLSSLSVYFSRFQS